MMRRDIVAILGRITGYSVVCGSILGGLYIKATEPTSMTALFWVDYFLIGLSPVVVVFWLPRTPWITFTGVGVSLAIELIALHLLTDCLTSHDCLTTTLASTALPFIYLYCIISMPATILVMSLMHRGGLSK